MSLYHGWDHNEMRQIGGVETSTSDGNISGPVLTSFTPINLNRAPLEFINPLETLHKTGIENTSYDILHEKIIEASVPKGKKRAIAQANNGRAVSIAQVWEYRDEGDVAAQNHGANFESSFLKRRKSVAAKRTTSVPSQSTTPGQRQFWEVGGANAKPLQDSEYVGQQVGSQLTTPPASGKRNTKRAVSLKPQNTKFKPGPFRNPVITKPSISCDDKAVTIHQGWTSTEEAVKSSQFKSISKTTLDKLAAFRYKSSADTQPQDRYLLTTGHLQKQEAQEQTKEAEVPLLPDEYPGFIPSDDSMLTRDLHVEHDPDHLKLPPGSQVGHSKQMILGHEVHQDNVYFNDAIWNVKASSAVDEDVLPPQTCLPRITSQSTPNPLLTAKERSPLVVAPQLLEDDPGVMQRMSDYGEPTSSESRALLGLVGDDPASDHNESIPTGALPSSCPYHEYNTGEGHGAQSAYALPVRHNGLARSIHVSQAYTDNLNEPPPGHEAADEIQHIKTHHTRASKDVHVERSDADSGKVGSRDVSNNFEFDEFGNDELDDADLLAIATDLIPETHPTAASGFQKSVYDLTVAESRTLNPTHANSESRPQNPTFQAPETSTSKVVDLDDEYPLEEGLEEEDMVSLPEHQVGVTENFQAPPSLQYSFGNDSMSGEVYDKSLQFSPPKARPSFVSSEKVANEYSTDKNSLEHTGYRGLKSIPTEEEDWSFIQSNRAVESFDMPLVSTPASEPHNSDTTSVVTKRIIPLGPNRRNNSSQSKPKNQSSTPTPLKLTLDDSHEYEPLQPFARPDFPDMVVDRCPIAGVSAQTIIRVCFRVGEMFREGARCNALKQDTVIELFARVTFSSREAGTTKQHFQFADLWHDRPPVPNGMLANYKSTGLAESESKLFIGAKKDVMARCIGRLKRDKKNATGWVLDIINIRPTDWEEIKWTKRVVSAGLVKFEKVDI